jgi:site-specific recombinase XerD
VDLITRTIRVKRVKGSPETIQPLEKRAGQPLLDEPKALRLWLDERKDDSHFVFTSQKGGALTTNAIWRLFAVIAEEAGITGQSTP